MEAGFVRRRQIDADLKNTGLFSYCISLYESNRVKIKRDHWIPDDQINFCMDRACHVVFTLTKRKHHCRSCGKIYCSSCSSYRLPVDENGHFSENGKHAKVCTFCFEASGKNINKYSRLKKYDNTTNAISAGAKICVETKPHSVARDMTNNFLKFNLSPSPDSSDKGYQVNSISRTQSTNHGVRENINKCPLENKADSDEYCSSLEESSIGGYVFNSELISTQYKNNYSCGGIKKYNDLYRNELLGKNSSVIDGVGEQSDVLTHYRRKLDINSGFEWSWSSF